MINSKSASNHNPSRFKRWLTSVLLQRAASKKRVMEKRKKLEHKRAQAGRRPVVEYFHQVDDAHSHLTIQLLLLLKQYDVELIIHLVSAEEGVNFPEPELWQTLAKEDAENIAPYYGLSFPSNADMPVQEQCVLVNQMFCAFTYQEFVYEGANISNSLWAGQQGELQQAAKKFKVASDDELKQRIKKGNQRRKKLQHFGSGNFWFEGEWYWKVDRFYHLENRLNALGGNRSTPPLEITPIQPIKSEFDDSAKALTLEYFVSLRSPYSAVSWEPTIKLAEQAGINLVIRPVLPMVMRGVPATYEKGKYFWFDAAREAEARGTSFEKFYDPIGKPVLQGYSLFNWANKLGKGNDVLSAFFNAAFVKGINLNKEAGLKQMIELAGLDWTEARQHLDDRSWHQALEENRNVMYQRGNWGVPCYHLLDADGKEICFAWGQDRLWLVANKMKETIRGHPSIPNH